MHFNGFRLNKMTLDHQLHATLDQEQGIVTVYNEPQTPILYTDTMAIFENLSTTVDLLHQKAQSVL
jgi:26S proteasome regulatory subunit N6